MDQIFGKNITNAIRIDHIIAVNYSKEEPSYEVINKKNFLDYLDVLSPYDENHPKWLPFFDYPDKKAVSKKICSMGERIAISLIKGRDTFKTFEKNFSDEHMK